MMRKIKSILSWVLLVAMMIGSMNLKVYAAEETDKKVENLEAKIDYYEADSDVATRTRFGHVSITVGHSSQGMEVVIVTATNGDASIIGVKDIKIKHKVWWGWETVATSTGGYYNNVSGMTCTIYYSGAVQGDTYKISCVHYADVDEYRELPNETTDFIYNF